MKKIPLSRLMSYLSEWFPISWKDTYISVVVLLLTAVVCLFLHKLNNIFQINTVVPMIFMLSVLIVSRLTSGFFYGVSASIIAVVGVNYAFTYPFMELNFTLTGYPLTFFSMLSVSIITCTMTTQIKRHENVRIEAEKEKMRANLLRAVSHDLRTPLTSISGSTSILIENREKLSEEDQIQLLKEVRSDAQWLIRMVENLLSITKINEKETKLLKRPEAVEEILGEAIIKFKKQNNISVSIKVPDELLMVPMDAMLIEQVIMNLLHNSIDHGQTTSNIQVIVTDLGSQALFSIADNGVGLKDSDIPHLFDGNLEKKDRPNSLDHNRNMGIGLSVCKTIIHAHGGTITAKNGINGGAVFCFTLPKEENYDNQG